MGLLLLQASRRALGVLQPQRGGDGFLGLAEFHSCGVWGFGPTVHAGKGTPWLGNDLFEVGVRPAGESRSRL